ncbi:hypothetical protein DRP04_15260, partial [Archaeoglobales archaeon]
MLHSKPSVRYASPCYPTIFQKKNMFPWDFFGGNYYMFEAGTEITYQAPLVVKYNCMYALGNGNKYISAGIYFPDDFEDESIEAFGIAHPRQFYVQGRCQPDPTGTGWIRRYNSEWDPEQSTADFYLHKLINTTETILASESVDLPPDHPQHIKLRLTGSLIEGFRTDMETPKIDAVDTDITGVGKWGIQGWTPYVIIIYFCKLLDDLNFKNETSCTKVIVQANLTEEFDDERGVRIIKPELYRELIKIEKLSNLPSFLYRQARHPRCPQKHVDLASVTYGLFDPKIDDNLVLLFIKNNNRSKILKQLEYARSKNFKVFKPKSDLESCFE